MTVVLGIMWYQTIITQQFCSFVTQSCTVKPVLRGHDL